MRYSVVIPVLNQLPYTRQCIDSLLAAGIPESALLIIDNGSSDDTPQYLHERPGLPSLRNPINLGCGGAWTQGALHQPADWVVLLNNDVVVSHDLVAACIARAEALGLGVVSPAMVEGELDYPLPAFTTQFLAQMGEVVREGWFHGVCFAVHRSVFEAVGYPDTDRQLGGAEDMEFLVRCTRAGLRVGTVGAALLHHFGSITQKALKQELGVSSLGDRHHVYRKLGMNWWQRKGFQRARRQRQRAWCAAELARYGMTLHMERRAGRWQHS